MIEQPYNAEATAGHFLKAGVSFIPIRVDGSKAPYEDWSPFENRLPTEAEALGWFGGGKRRGIAMIGGPVSGGLEIIDMESIADRIEYARAVELEAPGLLSKLVIVGTPTGGRHLIYRADQIEGNQKLAWRVTPAAKDDPGARRTADGGYVAIKTMIETRGAGGYVLAPGSPAKCHPTHKPYKLLQGDYTKIPKLNPYERQVLLDMARSFDQYEDLPAPAPIKKPKGDGHRPGDDFSDKATDEEVARILTHYGWEPVRYARKGGQHWRRPGKRDDGWSATLYPGGVLHCFTSNAPPFEPDHSYSPFDVLALLHFNGDFRKAARGLAKLGYGGPKP